MINHPSNTFCLSGTALLWVLTAFLSLTVTVPYTRGSNVNELHFFGMTDLPFGSEPSGDPVVRMSHDDHFHVFNFFFPARKTQTIKPTTMHQQQPIGLATEQGLPYLASGLSGTVVEFQGTSPPLDEYHTPSGLSPPCQYLS